MQRGFRRREEVTMALRYRQLSSKDIRCCYINKTCNVDQIQKEIARSMHVPWNLIELVSIDDCTIFDNSDRMSSRDIVDVMVHPAERNVPDDLKTSEPDITDPTLDEDRVLMSCNHALTPDNLYMSATVSLKDGSPVMKCFLCQAAWEFDEVAQKSIMTNDEKIFWGTRVTLNTIRKDETLDVAECPSCGSYCQRSSVSDKIVRCSMCQRKKGVNFDFCWKCKETFNERHDCERKTKEEIQHLLDTCTRKTMDYSNIPNVPTLRLCPKCGALIEHSEACKQTECKRCKTSFCFVCLGLCVNGQLQCSGYSSKCDVAQIQKVSNV